MSLVVVVVVVFGFVGACQTGFWMKQQFVVWGGVPEKAAELRMIGPFRFLLGPGKFVCGVQFSSFCPLAQKKRVGLSAEVRFSFTCFTVSVLRRGRS